MKQPAVYMLASRHNGTLYTGVTSDLVRRIWEHRNDLVEGFTKRYGVRSLVYFELHDDMLEAIRREKQVKKWNRAWKIELIERTNPQWQDLWRSLTESEEMDSRLNGKIPGCVVPAKAGTQKLSANLDSRLRGNDGRERT
ncbi:MAG: GIY-YIG nuclease family protein [Nitrospira sp.]|nr:GIY-YIG nuclease family protein [Nitrospira sp.]